MCPGPVDVLDLERVSNARDCGHDLTIHRHDYDFLSSVYFLILRLAAVFRRLHEKHIIAQHDWTWIFPELAELSRELVIGKVLIQEDFASGGRYNVGG